MDTSDPQIVFDQEGLCNHCTDFLAVRSLHRFEGEKGERERGKLFDVIRASGRGREYDCILGLSGGVDSAYATYLVKEAGLRPLAVHMDNGWDSEESVSNIKNITAKLAVDYQSYVLDWEEFRDLQLAFLKASVPEAETPTDVAIVAALHYFAAKHNVKHIISAGNLTTEGILPKSWHYNAKDLKYLNHIHKLFGRSKLKTFPTFDYKKEAFFKLAKGIRVVYPMNCVSLTNKQITDFLIDAFGYKPSGGKHYESRYTRFIQSYYLYEKFGIDYRRAKFSSEICSGQATREQAIDCLRSKPYDAAAIEAEKHYIAKKLKVSFDEFERVLALPPKWYWDYPNDERKLQFIYRTYLKLSGKDKLASF